jgi:hypothetical protein
MVAFQRDATHNIWTHGSKVMRFLRFKISEIYKNIDFKHMNLRGMRCIFSKSFKKSKNSVSSSDTTKTGLSVVRTLRPLGVNWSK